MNLIKATIRKLSKQSKLSISIAVLSGLLILIIACAVILILQSATTSGHVFLPSIILLCVTSTAFILIYVFKYYTKNIIKPIDAIYSYYQNTEIDSDETSIPAFENQKLTRLYEINQELKAEILRISEKSNNKTSATKHHIQKLQTEISQAQLGIESFTKVIDHAIAACQSSYNANSESTSAEHETEAREITKTLEGLIQNIKKNIRNNKSIVEKTSIINDLAFQTNILALNAAVEASHAGEHGKGFAVVAAEVRKMAEKSKSAADQINQFSTSGLSLSESSEPLVQQIKSTVEATMQKLTQIQEIQQSPDTSNGALHASLQELKALGNKTMLP